MERHEHLIRKMIVLDLYLCRPSGHKPPKRMLFPHLREIIYLVPVGLAIHLVAAAILRSHLKGHCQSEDGSECCNTKQCPEAGSIEWRVPTR